MKQHQYKYFEIEGFKGVFRGITFGDYWNGWEVPYFDKDNTLAILAMQEDRDQVIADNQTYYYFDEKANRVMEDHKEADCRGEVWYKDIGDIRYHCVGGMNWTWQEYKQKRMNPKVKAKWVDALRSGRYKQGTTGWLRHLDDRYCCAGVLTDIYINENDGEWTKGERGYVFDNEADYIHPDVQDWAGIDGHRATEDAHPPILTINGITADIVTHNDIHEVPFNVLADAIDEQL